MQFIISQQIFRYCSGASPCKSHSL